MTRDLSITELYERVEVDTLRGLVFTRGRIRPWTAPRSPYIHGKIGSYYTTAHRVVWAFAHGEWPPLGFEVDHINRDKRDNRLSNLRLVSRRQNAGNQRRNGVSSHPAGGWSARIKVNYRNRHLGYFKTRDEAVAVYRREHVRVNGEFSPYYEELKNEAS